MFERLYHFGIDILESLALLRAISQSIDAVKSRVYEEPISLTHDSQDVYVASARDSLVYEELLRECSRQAQQILAEQENLKAECQKAEYWKREYELSVHDSKLKLLLMNARNDALAKELNHLRCSKSHPALRTQRDAKLNYAHTY